MIDKIRPINLPKLNLMETESVPKKQSLKEWAAAGGGVPTQYKGREHVWRGKVKRFAEGGEIRMGIGGAIKKGIKSAIEAPTIIVPSRLSETKEAIRKSSGDYAARRLERAADEIPNLEKLYKEEAIRRAFTGDNAKAVATMNPKDFQKYARELEKQSSSSVGPYAAAMARKGDISKATVSTDEYIKHLQRVKGGFDDVPFLQLFKDEIGVPSKPRISGHEGRHRNMAMAENQEPAGLVQVFTRGDLREGLPRRHQDEYINALKDELELSGNLVFPESSPMYGRPPVDFPDVYAKGGEVHMQKGGNPLDEFSPPRYRSAGRRPESQNDRRAAANMPVDFARGVASGVLGAPGDIESLVRMLPGLDKRTVLPTSEDIEKRIPLRSDTPAGRAASGLGILGGGFYTGPGAPIRLVGGIPQAVYKAGKDFVKAAGQPVSNVVKSAGGNWLTGSVENAMKTLQQAENLDRPEQAKALNKWINSNLTNYVKKQMGTPEDPVRKLAEEGITHLPKDAPMSRYLDNVWERRELAGFPRHQGTSRQAQVWESLADEAINPKRLGDPIRTGNTGGMTMRQLIESEPGGSWATKAPDTQMVNELQRPGTNSTQSIAPMLGFDHIRDVLRHDLEAGLIRPEQLNKVNMEQAVKRTAEYDQEMAKKMAQTRLKATEGMPVHKEYPGGFKWVELTPEPAEKFRGKHADYVRKDYPDLERTDLTKFEEYVKDSMKSSRVDDQQKLADALKYEGETMGHCVGGYCPDVLEGKSRIYSLRDAKGEPHVTVETAPSKTLTPEKRAAQMDNLMHRLRGEGMSEEKALEQATKLYPESETFQNIVQIKGKGNRAPKDEYLPYAQDFVKSGQWSGVQDLANTGLYSAEEVGNIMPQGINMSRNARGLALGRAKRAGDLPEYMTREEYEAILQKHVPEDIWNYEKTKRAAEDDDLLRQLKPPEEPQMAGGGLLKSGLKKLLGAANEAPKGVEPIVVKAKTEPPLVFPRAAPKTKEDIRPMAQRMAEQMTGDFVRQNPKLTTNPAGKSRKQFEKEREIPLETRRLTQEQPAPFVDYESKKGHVLLGVPGDPTLGGVAQRGTFEEITKPTVELTRVGNVTPDQPVPLFGGPRYGDKNKFWASNYGAATPIQNSANDLSKLYDAPVLGQFIKMSPDSANFALHNLDSLLAIQQPEKLNKGPLRKLNSLVKQGSPKYGNFPGFVGFEDPIDVLLQSQLNSKLRKHIAEILTKPTITDSLGLPNGLDVVAAITHPQLRNLETGASGFSIGELRPGSDLRQFRSEHPTYATDIPGSFIGQSRYPIPAELAFPDTMSYARSQLTPGAQEFNMMKMLGPRERIDQQYIDEMKMYEELMKQYTGKKKGGLAEADELCGCHN